MNREIKNEIEELKHELRSICRARKLSCEQKLNRIYELTLK